MGLCNAKYAKNPDFYVVNGLNDFKGFSKAQRTQSLLKTPYCPLIYNLLTF